MANVAGFQVTLAKDINDEDAKKVADLLRLITGVAHVGPINSSPTFYMSVERARFELKTELHDKLALYKPRQ